MRRAMLGMTVATAVLALAGCKKQAASDQPTTIEQAARESAAMPRPVPGLYRSSVELISLDVPGMPPEAAARMKQMMASRAAPHEFCLTGEEAAKGYEERVKKLAGRPDCHFDHYSADGGRLDAQLTCTGKGRPEGAMRSVLTMQGTMGPEGSDLTLGMDQSGAQMPGDGMKMTMRVKSQRAGECPKA